MRRTYGTRHMVRGRDVFEDVWFEDVWFEDVWFEDVWFEDVWFEDVWFEDVWLDALATYHVSSLTTA